MDVYRGTVVHCLTPHQMEVLVDHLVGVDTANRGKIMFVEPCHSLEELSKKYDLRVHKLSESQFLMPGLVDSHIHAPLYKFTDTDHDMPLLDWLRTHTFPTEAMFSDIEVARNVYPRVVRRTLKHGTTTASYFATIHLESTKELCRIIGNLGQRALVGKVNMDQDCPLDYIEETQQSVEDTRNFIHFVRDMQNPLIQPMVTPRFARTCSQQLLNALGRLAQEMDVAVQSQICEQREDVISTLQHHTMHINCASIFDSARMLTSKTCMAHCIYLGDREIDMFRDRRVGIVHCPISNFSTQSGCLDVKKVMGLGIKVGLGTDVSRGYSPSILDAMRMALHTSKAVWFKKDHSRDYVPLSHHEALYLATLGGAQVLGLDNVTGNFEVGKEFDALIIDTNAPQDDPLYDDSDTVEDCVSKYLYHGDDRNIVKRFVAGKELVI